MYVANRELCQEEWRPVPGLESKFEVSNLGRIRSKYQKGLTRGRVRKLYTNRDGYQSISFVLFGHRANLSVHVAVARAFIPRPAGKEHVNHKDSNPSNNVATNLEWCTPAENVEHSRKFGQADRYMNRGEKHGMHKLTAEQVQTIRLLSGFPGSQVAKAYSVSDQTIYDIWNGKRWSHVR